MGVVRGWFVGNENDEDGWRWGFGWGFISLGGFLS